MVLFPRMLVATGCIHGDTGIENLSDSGSHDKISDTIALQASDKHASSHVFLDGSDREDFLVGLSDKHVSNHVPSDMRPTIDLPAWRHVARGLANIFAQHAEEEISGQKIASVQQATAFSQQTAGEPEEEPEEDRWAVMGRRLGAAIARAAESDEPALCDSEGGGG